MPPFSTGSEKLVPTKPPTASTSDVTIEIATPWSSGSPSFSDRGDRHQVRIEPQPLAGRLDHRAAIDVESELQPALRKDHDEIEPAEERDRLIRRALDGVVDDAPLQLERRKLEQEDADREHRREGSARGALVLQT